MYPVPQILPSYDTVFETLCLVVYQCGMFRRLKCLFHYPTCSGLHRVLTETWVLAAVEAWCADAQTGHAVVAPQNASQRRKHFTHTWVDFVNTSPVRLHLPIRCKRCDSRYSICIRRSGWSSGNVCRQLLTWLPWSQRPQLPVQGHARLAQ